MIVNDPPYGLYQRLLKMAQSLSSSEQASLKFYDWERLSRPSQRPPQGDWRVWLILAGRGFGKTRTGAETIRFWAHEKRYTSLGLIADTIQEARRVMVNGVSGIMGITPPYARPKWISSRELVWPNGAKGTLFGAEHYEQLRGPQFDLVWIDEWAKFRMPQAVLEQALLGLRLGKKPRLIVTTTPRPLLCIQDLKEKSYTVVTNGTTYENKENLAKEYIQMLRQTFENTSFGAQELYGQLILNDAKALWKTEMIRYSLST